jgi:putative heme-binding domain-containing protein
VVVNKRLPDEKPIELRGRDFRFDPLTGKAEAVSGNGQFGLCFDDWGNRFTCSNRNPVIHVVLEDRYLKLAPKIPIPAVVQDVAAAAEKSRIFAISRAWTTSNLHAGQFTAACGVHVYRGDTLRDVLGTNSVFTCDPTGNLVHLEKMKPGGPSFTSTPAYEGKEFLASPDEWFRPVSLETGPDGCLYIVDMYRCVIEHPDFVPDELKKRPDQRLGDDRGRIWRITPRGGVPQSRRSVSLAESQSITTEQLAHENAWHRETAQRLILANERKLWESPVWTVRSSMSSKAQVHALWLMHAQGSLNENEAQVCASHASEDVVRQLLLAAETAKVPLPRILGPKNPPRSERVKFQELLYQLSKGTSEAASDPDERAYLPLSSANRWMQAAVLLRNHNRLPLLFQLLVKQSASTSPLLSEIAALIAASGSEQESNDLIQQILDADTKFSQPSRVLLLDSVARGLRSRGKSLEQALAAVDEARPLGNAVSSAKLSEIISMEEAALQAKLDPGQGTTEVRLAATRLFGHLKGSTPMLITLLQQLDASHGELQSTLIGSLAQRANESAQSWNELLAAYDSQSLPIKRALVENSFRRADGPKLLLEQVAAGVIQPAEIDPLRRKQLLESKDAAIKEQAAKLFASLNPANRVQALADYQPVLAMAADAMRGKLVFEKNCSTCHKVGDLGVNVAPDISDSRTKTAAQILADVIQPNRAIDSNYIGYQVLLADGTIATGLLAAETSTSITLKQPGGKVLTLARDEIEQLKASGVSLMPEGLEKNIPQQDMADLLSFIKNWRYLDGKTPLSPGKGLGAGD